MLLCDVGETLASASLFGSAAKFPDNANLNAFSQDIYPTKDGWLCVSVRSFAEVVVAEYDRLAGLVNKALATRLREESRWRRQFA